MLVVISNPDTIDNEASLINQMFEAGMTLFHLRKPSSTKKEITHLLEKINSRFYSNIALHQHHELANDFKINRYHFTEEKRNKIGIDLIKNKETNFIYSTSVHSLSDYKNLDDCFDYTLLGPVFNSISKNNYKALDIKAEEISKIKSKTKLIAIGGATKDNMATAANMGFDGFAVLGSIWKNNNPLDELKQIIKKCKVQENTF